MNAIDPALPPVRGLVDPDGRLMAADSRLAALNAAAGGAIGAPLAVPPLATLARLAQRLRILISRGVRVADGDEDVELWVRAEPDEGGVQLAITGWHYRGGWQPAAHPDGRSVPETAGAWRWETDASLRLTALGSELILRAGGDANALLGQPLTRVFALGGGGDGAFPFLTAASTRTTFTDQAATIAASGEAITLEAHPRYDGAGRFAGFAGTAQQVKAAAPDAPAAPPPPSVPGSLGTQLDRALRGPLNRIVANAESIGACGEGALRPEYTDYAGDIATAGRHLLSLVDDLVDLQFVERDDLQVAHEAVDLADVARRAAGLLTVRAEAEGVRIDRPGSDDHLPAIGEFRRVLQVLVNLIGNAVRYSPQGGMVWIRLEREGSVAAVIVADQGKGIAAADQTRIFEKFERVDPSEPGGSGLGLYIARRLARAMGGDIVVDSAPGQGARFVFTLPAGDPSAA